MKLIEDLLVQSLINASKKAGYPNDNMSVQVCNIEGLGDFQCNDAMSMAKLFHKSPMIIAQEIAKNLDNNDIIEKCEVANPGFINITIKNEFLSNYLNDYMLFIDEKIKTKVQPRKTLIDYGGANVAKPLHVGHLRSADIGESIKRICKCVGNETLGDVHLGDWGLQIGMVISELEEKNPDLVYFDNNFEGSYPESSPVTIKDLEVLYPQANAKAKADENRMNKARQVTYELQNGRRGYIALWRHILNVSIEDLKKNYSNLNAEFDLWLGESDSQKYCDKVVQMLIDKGLAYKSDGALVVDVALPSDKKEVPPILLRKSDGSILYATTDLATIVQREKEYNIDRIIYVVDNRQEMHFTQVFRCINQSGILNKQIDLDYVGFGTMNGADGKPFKTRDGGTMFLDTLINLVKSKAKEKTLANNPTAKNIDEIADVVALAALKFADLSIYKSKDLVFDVDKFCSFEGKTGPYLLYTITRAKSILSKSMRKVENDFKIDIGCCDKKIIMTIIQYGNEVLSSYNELAPNILCDYVYRLANLYNSFYAKCNINREENEVKQKSWLKLTNYTLNIMEKVLNLLAIKTLDRM